MVFAKMTVRHVCPERSSASARSTFTHSRGFLAGATAQASPRYTGQGYCTDSTHPKERIVHCFPLRKLLEGV